VGGVTGSGGGGTKAAGGAPANGGATNGASMGGLSSGGSGAAGAATGGKASGGANGSTGGTNSGGATTATGGSRATGGTNATGGMPVTGGSKATGGTNTGGMPVTGGSKSTGGMSATGGSKSTGGAPATGGTATGGAGNSCGTTVRSISAMDLVKDMGLGWNLGNTLDATGSGLGSETAWGNPLTTQAMIQSVASAGFKSIRIPVTWAGHFGGAPGYVIDSAWMNRVQQIVDWAQAAGLYAIINMHHDGLSPNGWLLGAATNPTGVIAEYKALWAQIAQRFSCYSDKLILESMNEVGFASMESNGNPSQTAINLLNQLNSEFATLVRASGGNNSLRYLLVAGYWTDIPRSTGILMPDSRCILSVHYYTPSSFTFGSSNPWGSTTEVNSLLADWAFVQTHYINKNIPVILGEYGVASADDAASRVYWLEYVTKAAYGYGVAPYIWDDGGNMSIFNRRNLTWTTSVLDALKRAASGQTYTITKG
jgi:endoglucanase